MGYTQETAEVLALRILGWLAGNDELLPVFQGSTGASDEIIRAGATDPLFLGAVLDFVMKDDAWVVQCCDALGLGHHEMMSARQALPGGQQVHWT